MAKRDPFGSMSHYPCIQDFCEQVTQHRSGICEKCRTQCCTKCSKVFVSLTYLKIKKGLCANCKRNKGLK